MTGHNEAVDRLAGSLDEDGTPYEVLDVEEGIVEHIRSLIKLGNNRGEFLSEHLHIENPRDVDIQGVTRKLAEKFASQDDKAVPIRQEILRRQKERQAELDRLRWIRHGQSEPQCFNSD